MSKKSESIELRLPHETKQAFMARCQARGVTASAELRGFIDAVIAPQQRKRRFAFALPLGVIIGAALEAAIAGPVFAHADLSANFARLDLNHDGRISFAEFTRASEPQVKLGDRAVVVRASDLSPRVRTEVLHDVFARIDANRDGALSFDELRRYAER